MKRFRAIVESINPPESWNLWIRDGSLFYYNNGRWRHVSNEDSPDRIELETKVDSLDKEMGNVVSNIIQIKEDIPVELMIGDSTEVKNYNLKILKTKEHNFQAAINYGFGTAHWIDGVGGEAHILTSEGIMVFYNITTEGAVSKVSEKDLFSLIGLPNGGNNGQILKKSTDGYIWSDEVKVPTYENATTTKAGLMSSEDKTKLNSLNNYTLPPATKETIGGIKAGTNVGSVAEGADLPTVIGTINILLTQLRNCGVLK